MGSHFLNRPSTKMFKYILTISLLVTAIFAKPRARKLARSEGSSSWEWPSSWDDFSSGDWPSSWDDFSSGDIPSSWDMGIWELDHIMKNQVVVGNGLPVGMIFLQVIFLLEIVMEVGNLDLDLHPPAGIIWEVGNLDLDHQLADKKENEFLELGCLGLMAGFLFKDLNLCY